VPVEAHPRPEPWADDGCRRPSRDEDLQTMSNIWGTSNGPARERIDREELEKRELLMICYFGHDKYRVVNESPGAQGRRIFRVEFTKGALTRESNLSTVRGPGDRWYVDDLEITAMKDFCQQGSGR
jgi:hypothetical protein